MKNYYLPALSFRQTALLLAGVAASLLAVGDSSVLGVANPANGGIDPLQILNASVRNNVMFVIDTSSSMAGTVQSGNKRTGGDDPGSRFYQVKQAVRKVLIANAGKANYGLMTFHPDQRELQINPNGSGDTPGPMYYVTQDASGSNWLGWFDNGFTNSISDYDVRLCAGATCTATESQKIFKGFVTSGEDTLNTKYPATCSALANQIAIVGSAEVETRLTHAYNTNCRYYLKGRTFKQGVRYTIDRTGTSPAAKSGRITQSEAITCPFPPAGLLGDDTLQFADGTKRRACFQLRDSSADPDTITTYYLTGTNFSFVDLPGIGSSGGSCDQTGPVVNVSPCNVDATDVLKNLMKMELSYDANGLPVGLYTDATTPATLPEVTNLQGLTPSSKLALPATPGVFPTGIRQGNGTPILKAMQAALNNYNTVVLPARPADAVGKQKNFVILLTDGEESCGGTQAERVATATAMWNNAPVANNRIELFFVAFAEGGGANANAVARAGSGGARDAVAAADVDSLTAALNEALANAFASGEFSDQQSITESVFEYGALAGGSVSPLNPETRYNSTLPLLLQSTFVLPGFQGHLTAFRNNANASSELWDAGQKLQSRVALTGCVDGTLCTFDELKGDASEANLAGTNTAKIKRRIYSNSKNGFNASYTPTNLVGTITGSTNAANVAPATAAHTGFREILFPPSANVDPGVPSPNNNNSFYGEGILDVAFGISGLNQAQIQQIVPYACTGTNLPADCTTTSGTTAQQATHKDGITRLEARQMMIAYLAGAEPVKAASGGAGVQRNATSKKILYKARTWTMAESTLAAPGVVTPPLQSPSTDTAKATAYRLFRDGPRATTKFPYAAMSTRSGFGLRNPDLIDLSCGADSSCTAAKSAATASADRKPVMSVVYHATNLTLHAFRAGPSCAATDGTCTENGGEELWAFAPFDQLWKVSRLLVNLDSRNDKTYTLAAPVRFGDVFLPGSVTLPAGGDVTTLPGVWRTLMFFGRGAGGKFLTALDVTAPGPFTAKALATEGPVVVWSRGNPDQLFARAYPQPGATPTPSPAPSPTPTPPSFGADAVSSDQTTKYTGLGETWSVPAMATVIPAQYPHVTTIPTRSGVEFVLFVGSGFTDSSVATEGRTFFVLDALTGDVLFNHVIPDDLSNTLRNKLVASPASFSARTSGSTEESPLGYNFLGNPTDAKAKAVYFGDLQNRVWRFDPTNPSAAPTVFADLSGDAPQPFGTAAALLYHKDTTSATTGKPYVFVEAGNDMRVTKASGSFFKMYGYKDNTPGSAGTQLFNLDFPAGYRGTTQPATAFAPPPTTGDLPIPLVFFAGTRPQSLAEQNALGKCSATFDSILYALAGVTGAAAFDLRASGDDRYIELKDQRINAIRVSDGVLVVDTALAAQNPPPPPGAPQPTTTTTTTTQSVSVGATPGSALAVALRTTTIPYRSGHSAVCNVQ